MIPKKIFIPLLMLFTCQQAMAQQLEEEEMDEGPYKVVFVDSIHEDAAYSRHKKRPERIKKKTMMEDIDTLFSRRHKLKAVYDTDDEGYSDELLHCLRLAMDLWEDRLSISIPIKFFVSFSEDIDPDLEIKTTVNYSLDNKKGIPFNLYNQTHTDMPPRDSIVINADVEWDYSWSYYTSGGNTNLVTALLRHIGHLLGFGCSVTSTSAGLGFAVSKFPSQFDYCVKNGDGASLSSYARKPVLMAAFLSDTLHFEVADSLSYPLYSSSSGYVPHRSGNYLTAPYNNFMTYPYTDHSQLFGISPEVLDILSIIGWNNRVAPYDADIVGSDIDATGYGSAYTQHSFHAQDRNGNPISVLSWKYQLFSNSTNQYVDITTSTDSCFSPTTNVSNANSFTDDYDCLQGRIICTAVKNGVTKEYTKLLSLDLHPSLENISIANITTSSGLLSFDVTLSYSGATTGQLTAINTTGASSSYYFSGSGPATLHVTNVPSAGQTYLVITLHNSYGNCMRRIALSEVPGNTKCMAQAEFDDFAITAINKGEVVSGQIVIRDGEQPKFVLIDSRTGESPIFKDDVKVQWHMATSFNDGSPYIVPIAGTSSECSLKMHEDVCGSWSAMKYDVDFDTHTVYSEGVIRAVISGLNWKREYSYPIKLEVLPPMPELHVLSCKLEKDEAGFMQTTELEINAHDFLCLQIHYHGGEWPMDHVYGPYIYNGTPMPYRTIDDTGTKGCGYSCIAINKYGVVESCTVYPPATTGTDSTKHKTTIQFHQDKDQQVISANQALDLISITRLDGSVIFCKKDTKHVELHLPAGIYILSAKHGKESRKQKIIVK